MAIRDKILEKKVKVVDTMRTKKAALVDSVSIKTTDAKNAAKQSSRYQPTKDHIILNIIEAVDVASKSGLYSVLENVPSTHLKSVSQYFKSKKYIVAINEKDSEIYISWLGGKAWRKLNKGTVTSIPKLQSIIFREVTTDLSSKMSNKSGVKWVSPMSPLTKTGLYAVCGNLP